MIEVQGREMVIPREEFNIGTNYDTHSDVRIFHLKRVTGSGIDLSNLTFVLDLKYANSKVDAVELVKEVTDKDIHLTVNIVSNMLQVPGTVLAQIRALNKDGNVKWTSYYGAFFVEDAINTPAKYEGKLTELERFETDYEKYKNAEAGRVAAEEARAAAEKERAAAEAKRQATFELKETSRQTTFNANESARQRTFDANEVQREKKTSTATGAANTAAENANNVAKAIQTKLDNGEFIGPRGPMGATGPQGPQGEVGPQGPAGERGAQGPTGAQGPRGLTGATGAKGDTGATGAQGPTGATGPQGIKGATGPKGDTGPQGPRGPKGDTGESGVVVPASGMVTFGYDPADGHLYAYSSVDVSGSYQYDEATGHLYYVTED